MTEERFFLELDLESFYICEFCLRIVPIIIMEGFVLYLFAQELIKTQRKYDRIDRVVFFISLLLVGTDLFTVLFQEVAISACSHLLRLIWALALYFTFLRFVFEYKVCSKIFISTFLLLIAIFIVNISYFGRVPVRYPLLALYVVITFCGLHQFLFIREILSHERARKKSMNKFLQQSKQKQIEMELLDRKNIVEYKVLPSEFRYHIKLRKRFCAATIIGLGVNYFFLIDLGESRESIGQFFVILLVELLMPLIYYFYTTVNQWVMQQLFHKKQVDDSEESVNAFEGEL